MTPPRKPTARPRPVAGAEIATDLTQLTHRDRAAVIVGQGNQLRWHGTTSNGLLQTHIALNHGDEPDQPLPHELPYADFE